MAQYLEVHPTHPQPRLISQAVAVMRKGGVVIYPTDSGYALGCHIGDKEALDRIRRIRQLDKNHLFTLVCRDLSELATYAIVNNAQFRLLKAHTPGSYTFILRATKEVPRRLQHPKRKTIGLRVPEHTVTQALLDVMGEPIMSTTLDMPDDEELYTDPADFRPKFDKLVDLILDGGHVPVRPTTIVDLTEEHPVVVREGAGNLEGLNW
ncbi:MAG: threonylcarbamoyl-AMP synthase [Gammaproteobacteria bacterium]|nr:MAG: threonylcarbamoyl-AMP synthase [Gammaproteobacteria bacterium]